MCRASTFCGAHARTVANSRAPDRTRVFRENTAAALEHLWGRAHRVDDFRAHRQIELDAKY